MPLKTKILVSGGLMLAFVEVCIFLGSVIESNTLFLLGAASFFVGIMIREAGLKAGACFYVASIILGFLLTPNKIYVISYAGMGLYILIREFAWEKQNSRRRFWSIKIAAFNIIYLIGMLGGWELFIAKPMDWKIVALLIAAGQAGFYVYDLAYEYVQRQIWTKLRKRLF